MLKAGLYTLLALLSLAPGAQAESMQWSSIRDGSLYLRAAQPDRLKIGWSPAWQSDANREQLYLLQPDGQLFKQLEIRADQAYGEQDIELPAATGDYRLQIPGYSFRGFTVSHRGSTAAQFEPTKVHFSAEVHSGAELFFRVAAGEQAILAGKYYGGVSVLQASRLSDGAKVRLELKEHPAYGQFDQVALPPVEQDEVWRLALGGSGKAAFWLDGTANLFAQEVQQLHPLDQPRGKAHLQLNPRYWGHAAPGHRPALCPAAAVHLRSVAGDWRPRGQLLQLRRCDQAGARAGNRLSPAVPRALRDRPRHHPAGRYRAPRCARGGRPELRRPRRLAGRQRAPGRQRPALPGLRRRAQPQLPGLQQLRPVLRADAGPAKANPEARAAGVRIAMPASSRLLDGPFRVGAGQHRGIDWARKLLERHGQDIDALAWHEWMVRDLLATRRYRDSVRAAAELVGLDAGAGRARPCC